ncbi:MAG: hypothetical protein ABUL71_00725, partial [Gemmatimonadota bacterium]
NETTASNARVRALELDTTFRAAALALAAAPIGREGPTRLGDRLDMLRRRKALLDGPALYQAGLVEREAGHPDIAVFYDRDALRRGDVDSGLVELAMARDLYASGNPNEGRAMLVASAGDSTAAARSAFRREFEWVATPDELKTWDSLPPPARPDWVADFWAQRDVRDGRAPGERLVEHYRRMEFAYKTYRITLPQAGGRNKAATASKTVDMAAIDYMNFVAQHQYTIADTSEANVTLDVYNRLSGDAEVSGSRSPFKVFASPQALIDDRGVVYIRQGAPDASAHTTRGESLEMWVYDRPGTPLVLSFKEIDFDGQAGASQLVPTLLTENPLLRDQLCYLKASICSANADPSIPTLTTTARDPATGGSVGAARTAVGRGGNAAAVARAEQQRMNSGALLRNEVAQGKEAIATATTTDAFPQHFTKSVAPAVQIYGLDKATGGSPRLVATFAIPATDLDWSSPPAANGRAVYPVRIQLLAASRANGTEYHLDTLRRLTTPKPLVAGQFLIGYVELPLPPGTYATSVTITQEDGRGAIANLGQVVLPGGKATLSASDLVLGRDSGSVRWNSGSTEVAFNPLNSYRNSENAEVYFQLSGMVAGEAYETKFEFFRSSDDPKRAARLTIAFPMNASQSRMEISRNLGLKNLDPGQYRVKLTVRGKSGETTATGWVNIIK